MTKSSDLVLQNTTPFASRSIVRAFLIEEQKIVKKVGQTMQMKRFNAQVPSQTWRRRC
jgi:hypothetical protein